MGVGVEAPQAPRTRRHMWGIYGKNIDLQIKNIKNMFFHFYEKHYKQTCIKNIKLQMFPIVIFSPLYTQKISNSDN